MSYLQEDGREKNFALLRSHLISRVITIVTQRIYQRFSLDIMFMYLVH